MPFMRRKKAKIQYPISDLKTTAFGEPHYYLYSPYKGVPSTYHHSPHHRQPRVLIVKLYILAT